MKVICIKHIISLFLSFIIIFSSVTAFCNDVDYDEAGIYNECYTLYPDFVNNVKSFNVTDSQIIRFLGSVEKYILKREEALSEENFDEYMFDAIKSALELGKNSIVRDALVNAYPSAVPDACKGIVPEEYMPIYNTVKRILFGITTPIITLSGSNTALSVNHLYLPEDAKIIVGFYNADGILLHAYTNPEGTLACDCENLNYAKAFAFKGASLSPLCESYILRF